MSEGKATVSRRSMIKLAGAGGLAAGVSAILAPGGIVSAGGPGLTLQPEIPGVRLVDTRPEGPSGRLVAGTPRAFGPFTQLKADAQAIYGTVTALDWTAPGWLIVFNSGGQVPGELPGTLVANLTFGGPGSATSGAFLVGDTAMTGGQGFSIVIWPLRDRGPAPRCHVVVDVFGTFVPST